MFLRVSLGSVGRLFRDGCFLIFPLPINYGFELALVGSIIPIPASLDHSNRTTANGAVETSACNRQVPNAAISVGILMAAFNDDCIADKIGRHNLIFLVVCIALLDSSFRVSTASVWCFHAKSQSAHWTQLWRVARFRTCRGHHIRQSAGYAFDLVVD